MLHRNDIPYIKVLQQLCNFAHVSKSKCSIVTPKLMLTEGNGSYGLR